MGNRFHFETFNQKEKDYHMKLGQQTKDIITGMVITPVSIYVLNEEGTNNRIYCTPKGLNKTTGEPLDNVWLINDRLKDGPIEIDLPLELIGEEATDEVSGFTGIITCVIGHTNGCIHVELVSKKLNSIGQMIDPVNVDVRNLIGKAIKKYTDEQLEEFKKEMPSPVKYSRPKF